MKAQNDHRDLNVTLPQNIVPMRWNNVFINFDFLKKKKKVLSQVIDVTEGFSFILECTCKPFQFRKQF